MKILETFGRRKWLWIAILVLILILLLSGNPLKAIFQFIAGSIVFWLLDLFSPREEIGSGQTVYEHAGTMITAFLESRIDVRQWKSFLNTGMNGDYRFIAMQQSLLDVADAYPPVGEDVWCSDEGREKIKDVATVISDPDWTLEDLAAISHK